jgi:hypothetical protein
MAKKPTVTTISSGYASNTQLNANFVALRDAFDNTLSLDGSTPNTLTADLDVGSQDLLNVGSINGASASGLSANLDTVAGISGDITTVAGISADVTQVAADTVAINAASANASAAAASAGAASTSETNAAASEAAAAASYDSFDDRYLGAKAADPTVDNDGDPLITGALYFNTTSNEMRTWNGSVWVVSFATLSGALIATNNLSDLDNAATALTNLGVTSTAAELNILDGVTSTTAELNILDGVTASTAEINHLVGVTSSVQAQVDAKYTAVTQTQATWDTGTDTTESLISPAKNKGAFDTYFGASEQQIGVGQTWQDVSASRTDNTSYQNTTGKPIAVTLSYISAILRLEVSTDNSTWVELLVMNASSGTRGGSTAIVPDQHYYRTAGGTVGTRQIWAELR